MSDTSRFSLLIEAFRAALKPRGEVAAAAARLKGEAVGGGRVASERRLGETAEQAGLGITRIDAEGRFVEVNQKFCEMLGYSREELVGRSTRDVTHPDDYGSGPAFRSQLFRSERPQVLTGEKRYVRRDGSHLWTRRTMSPALDAEGRFRDAISVVEDITERRRAEEAAQSERTLLRTIIDAIPHYIYVKDHEGRLTLINKAWLDYHGMTAAGAQGKTVFDLFDLRLAEEMEATDRSVIDSGVPSFDAEQRIVISDPVTGETKTRWSLVTKVPLHSASGAVIGLVGISREITASRRMERERAMEHGIAAVLSESLSIEETFPRLIRSMCETMEWEYGARWVRGNTGEGIRRAEWWCSFEPRFDPEDARGWVEIDNPDDSGLIGKAWLGQKAAWVSDITTMPGFRRKASCVKFGFRSAYAFPVIAQDELLGVIEFFGREPRELDEGLLESSGAVSIQIGQFIRRKVAEKSLKESEERFRRLAHYDTLTELPNRALFYDRLTHAIAQAKRERSALAVLFVDVDRFKNVNDTLGHAAGDALLKLVSARLVRCVRASDTVGRQSGDEFAIVLSRLAAPEDAATVARKIVAELNRPFQLEGQELYVTASIGITVYPADSDDQDMLIRNADVAMYRAKELGRNNYQFYTPEMNRRTREMLTIEGELRRALERGELELHYQPKIGISARQVTGVEALMRWRHPERGLISPGEFIPVLEETGLIVQAGEWVLREVCRQLGAWQAAGVAVVPVAINLSARQFLQPGLGPNIKAVLSASGTAPELLEVEITESSIMQDTQEATRTLEYLDTIGVSCAIDDFGTGYSSLAYLKRFPLSALKVDRSFIRDLETDPDDATITRAVISMAHSLGLKVIAEGVETREQLAFLMREGCEEVQGFLFSRPLPPDALAAFLADPGRIAHV